MTPIHINEKITTFLSPEIPSSTTEAHKQCNKAISTIVRQTSNTLIGKLRENENKSYYKIPKHYHNNLKISAGLLPRARDQPRVITLTHPITKTTHTQPHEAIGIVTTRYMKERQRVTPDHLLKAHGHNHKPRTTTTSHHHPTTQHHTLQQPSTHTSHGVTTIGRLLGRQRAMHSSRMQ